MTENTVSISCLSQSINGLIYFPLLTSIPFSPDNPLPLNTFIIIVSTLSFLFVLLFSSEVLSLVKLIFSLLFVSFKLFFLFFLVLLLLSLSFIFIIFLSPILIIFSLLFLFLLLFLLLSSIITSFLLLVFFDGLSYLLNKLISIFALSNSSLNNWVISSTFLAFFIFFRKS